MKHRKSRIIVLLIGVLFFFLFCAKPIQKKDKKTHYKVILAQSININSKNAIDLNTDEKIQISDEDTKYVENIIAVISNKNDSIITYNFQSNFKNVPDKNLFTSRRENMNTRIFTNFKENEKIQVAFIKKNMIKVENDLYELNQKYYEFLKEEVLEKGSVLELVSLIKDGYGDYSHLFNPLLDYKWSLIKNSSNFKILKVNVNSVNYSGEITTPWEILYSDNSAVGERFNKKLIESNDKFNIYKIESTDERNIVEEVVYKNKKTKLDSIVIKWYLYSTNTEYKYTQYQTKLKIVETAKPPKDIEAMLKLFND